jgi:acyl-CoA synthetase (AMP-forming)/AMP-acid ligase II
MPFAPSPTHETLVDLLLHRAAERGPQVVFVFPIDVHDVTPPSVTYADVDRRAKAIAARLSALAPARTRILILYPPGAEFVTAFFGALYAGMIAVPAYPVGTTRLERTLPRLHAMLDDAEPTMAFAPRAVAEACVARDEQVRDLEWLAAEDIPDAAGRDWMRPPIDARTVAIVQYTSGSTATPKGVVLTHGNVLANLAMLREGCGTSERSVFSSWLPLAHDMGLFGRLLTPIYVGGRAILTSPELFIERPIEWLGLVSRLGATCFGGPNLAYERCVRSATTDALAQLDLSRWELATVGSEVVRPSTLAHFAETFAPAGFRREVFLNGYGLAEATLFVCGAKDPRILSLDHAALAHHLVRQAADGEPARRLVSAGRPPSGVEIAIVDPQTRCAVAADAVGEIWVAGAHIGQGYWSLTDETAATFGARRRDADDEGPYLRTGDLGFISDGELFVTGRLKDLIIVHGRNVCPEDIEATVAAAHPLLRSGGTAAFALQQDDTERLVVLQEVRDGADHDVDAIVSSIRACVADEHDVVVDVVVLIGAGSLRKTTSGKVQRSACREAYHAGTLDVLHEHAWLATVDPGDTLPFVPPRTPTEHALAQLWMEALDADRVSVHDNFLDLGGQSVQANLLIGRVLAELGVELQPHHFFSETATIAEHACTIDGARANGSAAADEHKENQYG